MSLRNVITFKSMENFDNINISYGHLDILDIKKILQVRCTLKYKS